MKFFYPLAFVGALSLGLLGCAEKSTTKREYTAETPTGKTTVTVEKEVTTEGTNPPAIPRN